MAEGADLGHDPPVAAEAMRAETTLCSAGRSGVDAAGRLQEAAVATTHEGSTGPADLESKAKVDKWQRIMVEAKELKRQWADLEDSDEEAPGASSGEMVFEVSNEPFPGRCGAPERHYA